MKVTLSRSSNIASAFEHVLKDIIRVPPSTVVVSATEHTGIVAADGQTYHGLLPILRVLRDSEKFGVSHKSFLSGSCEEETLLINQWVSVASTLSAEISRYGADAITPSVADVERIMETHHLHSKYLANTQQASVADVLFYAALHHGRSAESTKQLPPLVVQWSLVAQSAPEIAPIKSPHIAHGKPSKKEAAAEGSAYVKPSEEEIQRRREEKEKAKKAKEAAKAAAAAGGDASAAPAAGAKKESKGAAKPENAHAQGSKKNPPKAELDFGSLDVRVGMFTNVRKHPSADRLYVEDMVLGSETRTIVSGLVDHFSDPKDLEGKQILVMCNMKPKPLLGVTSHGMILCASNDHGLSLVSPPEGAKPGDRIVFGPAYSEPGDAPDVLSSNKMSDVLSHLHTNGDGVLCWKDTPAYHANGIICVPSKKNCIVK